MRAQPPATIRHSVGTSMTAAMPVVADVIYSGVQIRGIMLDPAHDGGVSQRQAAFRHHPHQIAVAELETQIPSHAEDYHLPAKVPGLKQLIQPQKPES